MLFANKNQQGFTLIEVLIALVLLSLLLGGVAKFVSWDNAESRVKNTVSSVQGVEDALKTFLLVNKYLPCPDEFDSGDAKEDRNSNSTCKSNKGFLPTETLDIKTKDGWGNKFYYRVNSATKLSSKINNICHPASIFGKSGGRDEPSSFAQCEDTGVFYCNDCSSACDSDCDFSEDPRGSNNPPYFHLSTRPFGVDSQEFSNLKINDPSGVGLSKTAVAVIVSFGKNGSKTWENILGSSDKKCSSSSSVVTSAEVDNCDGGITFTHSLAREVDDYLGWIDLFDVKRIAASKGFFE